jgi:hypothetical protein
MPRYYAIIDTDTEFDSPESAAASLEFRLSRYGGLGSLWKDVDTTVYQDLDDMLMDAGEGVGPFDLSDKRECAQDSAGRVTP